MYPFTVSQYNIYSSNVLTVKKFGSVYKAFHMRKKRISGFEKSDRDKSVLSVKPNYSKSVIYPEKLDNNISRARSAVWTLIQSNNFDYFITLTFDSSKVINRHDRKSLIKSVCRFFNNYAKNRNIPSLKYILIPEFHKDGAIHLHGVISGIRETDLFINEHGYLDWKQYHEKFGFINIENMHNKSATASYVTKYISKDLAKGINKGEHLYYCSKRLSRGEKVLEIKNVDPSTLDFEFISDDSFYRCSSFDDIDILSGFLSNMTLFDDGCEYDPDIDDFISINYSSDTLGGDNNDAS